MINTIVGNYKITKLIGEGGMGSVYEGFHTQISRKVAIKVLHTALLMNQELKDRFKNEALAMSSLVHPNIVSLHDYIENEMGMFLVMEYVEGIELDELLKKRTGPLTSDRAIKLFSQVLDAVGYAHSKGIIHRDIKPSNIMIMDDDTVKILDFGIARLVGEGDKKMTKTGTRMGTVLYMSPEQVRAEEVDNRTDIYSLGVVLFEMLTGKSPYDSSKESEFDINVKIVKEPLPWMSRFYPAVDMRFQQIIEKATSKDKLNRYSSCEEFKQNLHLVLKSPLNEEPIPQKKKKKFPKVIVGLIAIILIIILGISVIPNLLRKEPTRSELFTKVIQYYNTMDSINWGKFNVNQSFYSSADLLNFFDSEIKYYSHESIDKYQILETISAYNKQTYSYFHKLDTSCTSNKFYKNDLGYVVEICGFYYELNNRKKNNYIGNANVIFKLIFDKNKKIVSLTTGKAGNCQCFETSNPKETSEERKETFRSLSLSLLFNKDYQVAYPYLFIVNNKVNVKPSKTILDNFFKNNSFNKNWDEDSQVDSEEYIDYHEPTFKFGEEDITGIVQVTISQIYTQFYTMKRERRFLGLFHNGYDYYQDSMDHELKVELFFDRYNKVIGINYLNL